MAKKSGKEGKLTYNGVELKVQNIKLSQTKTALDVSDVGDVAETYIGGMRKHTCTFDLHIDSSVSEQQAIGQQFKTGTADAESSIRVYADKTGDKSWSFSALVISAEVSIEKDGVIMMSCSANVNGEIPTTPWDA